MTGDLIKRMPCEEREIQTGRMPYEHEGREQNDTPTRPEVPKIAGKPPEAER